MRRYGLATRLKDYEGHSIVGFNQNRKRGVYNPGETGHKESKGSRHIETYPQSIPEAYKGP